MSLELQTRNMQERTFCKWCVCRVARQRKTLVNTDYRLNTKLEANGYPTMSSLVKDLSDGVRLIQLMVSIIERISFFDSKAFCRRLWVSCYYVTVVVHINVEKAIHPLGDTIRTLECESRKQRTLPRPWSSSHREELNLPTSALKVCHRYTLNYSD